ncbi:lysozyme inhibitor LprI family protein [Flavobacterium wongokense]|uniref:lysozyme inhibitor LprI family protein n=1 Tax=Flavobacterium wongokense TaxID=2910674 RepID=UPI001F2ABBF3|nr:lysozyme inhibitor LprI family protein [Flavobacterium sp. WG47]MCF6130735.1 DUF1311 domain-containing protein [Flavobacterium sp. WG47]
MKTKCYFLLFVLSFVSISFAQTQTQLNEKAYANYKKADAELNTVYNRILKGYQSDAEFIRNLKKSQKIWIAFRDAEMLVKYPNRGSGTYATSHQMCWYNYITDLTRKRTKELNVWLLRVEEGDVCAGSVKTR